MFTRKIKSEEIRLFSETTKMMALMNKINVSSSLFFGDSTLYATFLATIAQRAMKLNLDDVKVYSRSACLNIDSLPAGRYKLNELSNAIAIIRGQPENVFRILVARYQFSRDLRSRVIAHIHENSDIVVHDDIIRFFDAKGETIIALSEPETNSALIIISGQNIRPIHGIQAFIPVLMPKMFEGENAPTEDEKALFNTLMHHRYQAYIDAINRITDQIDISQTLIEQFLTGFTQRLFRGEIARRQEEYNRKIRDLERWNNEYQAIMNGLQLASDRLAAAMARNTDEDDHELIELFKTTKVLELSNVNGGDITFNVNKYIDNFDPEVYRVQINNHRSFFYTPVSYAPECWNNEDDRKLFLDAVFGDRPVYKIRTFATYMLSVPNSSVHCQAEEYLKPDRLGNPHIMFYHCLGQHQPAIQEKLRQNNITGAIAQCMASAGSLNLAEAPTVTHMLEYLGQQKLKCIERISDHKLFTAVEALQALKEETNGTEH